MRIRHIFHGPGTFLLFMIWWIFAFFVLHLFSFPVDRYLKSYVPFFIAFTFCLMCSMCLNLADSRFKFWKRMGCWAKFATLMGSYTVTIGVILVITVMMSAHGKISYFGGDPEGSFGMLYIPSIIFYGLSGSILICVVKGVNGLKMRLSSRRSKP